MRAILNVELPKKGDGTFIGTSGIHAIFRAMGLEPSDLPSGNTDEGPLREYLLRRAKTILDKMPHATGEEQARKERTEGSIIYVSELPSTNTLFMANRYSNGIMRLRLWNPKLEDLQEGCEDFVRMIRRYARRQRWSWVLTACRTALYSPKRFPAETPPPTSDGEATQAVVKAGLKVIGRIWVFEHGLEDATISGTVIENRLQGIRKFAKRHLIVGFFCLLMFFILWPLGSPTPPGPRTWIEGNFDRLATAMLTAVIISLLDVLHIGWNAVPPIRWQWPHEPVRGS